MVDIFSAFGLATASGLNAYIPLLLVALAARFPLESPLLKLAEPYNQIGEWWAILIIAILLVIEMLVDKIPAIDSINDGIQTFIRPAAGAVLFAANADMITDVHPAIALIAGLTVAGGVHTVKSMARPAVTAATVGSGNWFVSLLEDISAFFIAVLSIFIPFLAIILFVIGAVWFVRFMRRRRKRYAYPM